MCQSKDELKNTINKILSNKFSFPESLKHTYNKIIDDWFYKTDGLAYKRISNLIEKKLKNYEPRKSVNNTICKRNFYNLDNENLRILESVNKYIKYFTPLPYNWSFKKMRSIRTDQKWKMSDKYFDQIDIINITKGLDDVLPKIKNLNVLPISECIKPRFGYTESKSIIIKSE